LSRTSTLAGLGAQAFTYDPNDRLDTDGYDPNGNTTSADGSTYAYDFENRLVSKNGGAVTIVYDGDGNRVAKTVGGVTTKYLVDDLNPTGYLQVMEEVSAGAVQTRYTFGSSLVSQTRNTSTTPVTSYYGYDAHGNITFLTDTNGIVTDSYDYDAWGKVVATAGTTPNTRLYTGEELDTDLGLIALRSRYYDAGIGRFLTIDDPSACPEDRTRSHHEYLYASADPANLVDPRGLSPSTEYVVVQGSAEAVQQTFLYLLEQRIKQLRLGALTASIGSAPEFPGLVKIEPDEFRTIMLACKICFRPSLIPVRVRIGACLTCATGVVAKAISLIPGGGG
jgi:RHS repeat-associated protein